MRRALGALVVLALIGFTQVALAVSEWENYKDTFSSGGYSGNDGSLAFDGPWHEVGESNGAGSGIVRVENGEECAGGKCLIIGGPGLLTLNHGAYRLANLDDFVEATLTYTVGFDAGLFGLGTATLTVSVTSNGGASWSQIDSVALAGEGDLIHRSRNVSGWMSEDFGVRFTMTGLLGTSTFVDDVEIAGTVPVPTTTTTSTTTTTISKSTTTTTTTLVSTTLTLPPPTIPPITLFPTTTTTTRPGTTTTTTTTIDRGTNGSITTTTTEPSGTTTTLALAAGSDGPEDPIAGGGGTDGTASRLRQTAVGIESDFETGLFGPGPEVLAFEIDTGFANAVELIEASWHWVLALALLIAAALIKGIDRRIRPAPEVGS